MRIRLGILANNIMYLNRLVAFITSKHHESFEVYSFTENESALKTIQMQKIDVLLVEEGCNIETKELFDLSYVIYLVESRDNESMNQCPTIFKYQKIELIVKDIWNIYSEVIGNVKKANKSVSIDCKVFAFASPCGGSGSSTLAVSSALYFARHGKNVMYLNFEKMSASDVYFCGEGTQTLSDMIFALKGKKSNLRFKLDACLKRDIHNISFFSQTKQVLDMYELTVDEQIELINVIIDSGMFDTLILDLDFNLMSEQRKVYLLADRMIVSSDGSEISNQKIKRFHDALMVQEQGEKVSLLKRIVLIYNKITGMTRNSHCNVEWAVIGAIPMINDLLSSQIPDKIAMYDLWGGLV